MNEIFESRPDTDVETGIQLAKVIGRATPYDRSSVVRFLSGEVTTRQMAEAFALLYGLPFIFQARSLDEAMRLQGVAKSYDAPQRGGVTEGRVQAARERLEELEESARGHTQPVESANEGRGRGRRTRRTARGGASSA